MSWQAFVDTSLVGTGHITKGAIISIAGDSAWASSPELTIQPAEMKVIADIVAGNQAAIDKAYAEGIHVAGVRYVLTKTADDIYARAGRDGVCITPSKQAIVVGIHNEAVQAGNATSVVAALADHLKKTGY
ncbi:profilin domain-containing protein [Trichoderma breve]|uniref:Profilin n=1 Tax=Trichoderma breve TaxID=2034170 RepID=A0A9W9EDM5_9HYPO|nr:profilin domain-containing protein [Trichoderma breve]KAJ4864753.1 profilin domain-containing protein [Trichoderma breve]